MGPPLAVVIDEGPSLAQSHVKSLLHRKVALHDLQRRTPRRRFIHKDRPEPPQGKEPGLNWYACVLIAEHGESPLDPGPGPPPDVPHVTRLQDARFDLGFRSASASAREATSPGGEAVVSKPVG